MSETLLWSNPSPTSSFAAQNVTLSQSMNNFDYIKVTFRASTSVADEGCNIYPIEYVKSSIQGTAYAHALVGGGSSNKSNFYTRKMLYVSNTQLNINGSVTISSNNAGSNNGVVIPLEIYGLK